MADNAVDRERAIVLRDLALRVVEARGTLRTVNDRLKMLDLDDSGLRIAYSFGKNVAHELHIWGVQSSLPDDDSSRMLFDGLWNDTVVFRLSYLPGEWEQTLANLAAECLTQRNRNRQF